MSKIKKGLCLYTIEKDGCLNGVYTHEGARGVISNEIARKHPKGKMIGNGLADRYNSYYFDTKGVTTEIKIKLNNGEYQIDWVIDSEIAFKGYGYLMNANQLVVQYVSTSS